jgi:hypothetical protein
MKPSPTTHSRPAFAAAALSALVLLAAGGVSAQTTSRALASAPAPAAADSGRPSGCPCAGGERLTANGLRKMLEGRTVCATAGDTSWSDFHRPAASGSEGELWAYRRGPGHAVDPTARTGSWVIEGSARAQPMMTYIYGANRYSHAVCQEGQRVHFCGIGAGSRNILNATVRDGQVPCN